MRNLDLFSGIGGFTYAAEKLVGGITTTQFVENNKFCQEILRKHWPDIPIHDDIKTFNAKKYEYDSITAGFPCQDLSSSGAKRGIEEGTRSSLFYEVIRLARQIRPKFILLENVRNLLSHQDGKTFQEILFQIAKSGNYEIEWAVVSAKDLGACHLRQRIWILAYADSIGCGRGSSKGRSIQERSFLSGEQERSEMGSEIERCSINNYRWRNTKHRLDPNWKEYGVKPTVYRDPDGVSSRLDKSRIHALGNALVPQVAAIPLQRIKDLNEHFSTTT